MDPTSPITRTAHSARAALPASGRSIRRHVPIIASLITALVATLGCTLSNASLTTSPPPDATLTAQASASSLHPTGFLPDWQAPPAPEAAYAGPPTGTVDLSANNPPVGNQLDTGPCSAWATGYYLRGWYAKRDGYYPRMGFAPMYTYAQIVHGQFAKGSTFAQNLDIQEQQGLDTIGDYAHGIGDSVEQPTDADRTNAARYKIASYFEVGNPNHSVNFLAWIIKKLNGGDPLALGIPVYREFANASPSSYFVGVPASSGAVLGYHAVFAYGYDHRGLWIENQWGTNWGNAGYAELSWDFVVGYAINAVSIVPITPAASWQQLPGAATDISVGTDGSVWALGVTQVAGGYDIYHWNATTWTWSAVRGGAVRIAVDPSGSPWIITNVGTIFHWDAGPCVHVPGLGPCVHVPGLGTWLQVPGLAREISIGADGSIWTLGYGPVINNAPPVTSRLLSGAIMSSAMTGATRSSLRIPCGRVGVDPSDTGIYRWTGATWQQLSGSAAHLAVDPSGLPWVVNSCGAISRWTGSAWVALPGAAKDIAIGGPHCACIDYPAVINTDSSLTRWDWLTNSWQAIPGLAVDIAEGPSFNPWVITSSGAIFQLPAPADL